MADDYRDLAKSVVKDVFAQLIEEHKSLLIERLNILLKTVRVRFGFKADDQAFIKQLEQNNKRDTLAFLLMLLPFIDDPNGDKKKNIINLNDIYVNKNTDTDINEHEPKYLYSNIQYNRCIRQNRTTATERPFDVSHLDHNLKLLLDTIQTVSYKLYTNWVDVVPIGMQKYRESDLYKDTNEAFNNQTLKIAETPDKIDDSTDVTDYNGLHIGDIYHALVNYLYKDVLPVKWFMYEHVDNSSSDNVLTYLNLLVSNSLLNDDLFNGKSWKKLDRSVQDRYSNAWRDLKNKRQPDNKEDLLVKTIAVFQERFKSKKDDGDKEEEQAILKIGGKKDVVIDKLDPEDVYSYIQTSLHAFRKTWYGSKLISKNEITSFTIQNQQTVLTAKNVYNYAKSLYFETKEKTDWRSLEEGEKNRFVRRIYEVDPRWFKISFYVKEIRKKNDVGAFTREISTTIHKNLISIVFETFITRGTLTIFSPNPAISDNINYEESSYEAKTTNQGGLLTASIRDNREDYNSAYHYITNTKYEDMPIINFVDKQGNKHSKPYLDQIGENFGDLGTWNVAYAMDWVSQISFFHRYLNNRVIYVTGSTGVGKSTQIPKLLLYALKMIDHKSDGNIVCTQPRTAPTEGNTKIVSKQLGVPIEEPSEKVDDSNKLVDSDNYYLQYKHQKKKHAKSTADMMLKIVTDGTLYEELKNTPVLIEDNKSRNIYDIVIVDEAHEHNKNMDLILTMMRYGCYHNPTLRLVIVSATMDDDEPVYRRYYRDINDNQLFPSNTIIKNQNLDRINVDRRLHISPPGESTRFSIVDNYVPDENGDSLVLKLMTGADSEGDLLYFQPGQADINRSITFLNDKLPSDMIALPFYGSMKRENKEMVENIDKRLFSLVVPRDVNFNEYTGGRDVPQNTYKRVVVVATNIAEASITIKTLRYVVETGTQKVMMYNHLTGRSQLTATGISESSRIQRRGRVGRVANGKVYYLYNLGDKEDNRTMFDISVSDVHMNLFHLLEKKEGEAAYKMPNSLPKTSFTYKGQDDQYDYSKSREPPTRNTTGYTKKTVSDLDGSFHIVHPDERCLNRNILGTVISVVEKDPCDVIYNNNNTFTSPKIESFWRSMQDKFLIYNTGSEFGGKTIFATHLATVQQSLDLNTVPEAVAYLYSRLYGVDKQVMNTLLLLQIIGGEVSSIFPETKDRRGKTVNDMITGKQLYSSSYGDCHALSVIGQKIVDATAGMDGENNVDSLNSSVVVEFNKKYKEMQERLDTTLIPVDDDDDKIQRKNQKKKKLKEALDWTDANLKAVPSELTKSDPRKITVSFLHANGINTALHIGCSNLYLPISNPAPENANKLSTAGRMYNTLLKDESFSQYINYMHTDDFRGFSVLNRVTTDMIQETVPFAFSPLEYRPERYDVNRNKEAVGKLIGTIDTDKTSAVSASLISDYLKANRKIRVDMLNSYTPDVYRRLINLDSTTEFKSYLEKQIEEHLKYKRTGQSGGFSSNLSGGGSVNTNNCCPLNRHLIKLLYYGKKG